MGGRLCQRGGLVIPRAECGSVAVSPFRERAAVLQAQPFDVGARRLPGVRPARLALQGAFCIAPFGQDQMRLPGEQLARAVAHLCDRFDEVSLLARRVEDLAGKRFPPAGSGGPVLPNQARAHASFARVPRAATVARAERPTCDGWLGRRPPRQSSRSSASGNAKPNSEPPPSRGWAQIRPPRSATACLLALRPMPRPPLSRRAASLR